MIKTFICSLFLVTCFSQSFAAERIISKNLHKYYALNGYNAEGRAKVYSQKFHNRKTASGMRFSQYAYTAASVKLPLMSVVRITNKSNGKSISVLINDRGPYKTNALLDLSKASAKAIEFHYADKIMIEFDMQKTLELKSQALKEFRL